jgi:hypothetical protein
LQSRAGFTLRAPHAAGGAKAAQTRHRCRVDKG